MTSYPDYFHCRSAWKKMEAFKITNRKKNLAAFLLLMIQRRKKRLQRRNRTIWVKPWILRRNEQGVHGNLVQELGNEDPEGYRKYFRLSKENFEEVLSFVVDDIRKLNTVMRESLSPDQRLSITLRFLATGEAFRSLHHSFRCGESTVSKVVLSTCQAIYENMKDTYLKTPSSEEEWMNVARQFEEKWNYPCCVGAIDGKHIAIAKPSNSGSLYFNYKHFFSIILLAVVDANYKFLYVDVGAPGRYGNSGVYENSTIKEALDTGALNLPEDEAVGQLNFKCKHHFIGDDAFALTDRMMKPYSHRLLEKEQQIFNYRLSWARRVVENGFGILANRFRVFLTTINLAPEKVELIVLAACCLHNYLLQHSTTTYSSQSFSNESHQNSSINEQCLIGLQSSQQRNASNSAKNQRENLKLHFLGTGAVPWQDSMI